MWGQGLSRAPGGVHVSLVAGVGERELAKDNAVGSGPSLRLPWRDAIPKRSRALCALGVPTGRGGPVGSDHFVRNPPAASSDRDPEATGPWSSGPHFGGSGRNLCFSGDIVISPLGVIDV